MRILTNYDPCCDVMATVGNYWHGDSLIYLVGLRDLLLEGTAFTNVFGFIFHFAINLFVSV